LIHSHIALPSPVMVGLWQAFPHSLRLQTLSTVKGTKVQQICRQWHLTTKLDGRITHENVFYDLHPPKLGDIRRNPMAKGWLLSQFRFQDVCNQAIVHIESYWEISDCFRCRNTRTTEIITSAGKFQTNRTRPTMCSQPVPAMPFPCFFPHAKCQRKFHNMDSKDCSHYVASTGNGRGLVWWKQKDRDRKKTEPQASSPCLKEGARHLGHDTTWRGYRVCNALRFRQLHEAKYELLVFKMSIDVYWCLFTQYTTALYGGWCSPPCAQSDRTATAVPTEAPMRINSVVLRLFSSWFFLYCK